MRNLLFLHVDLQVSGRSAGSKSQGVGRWEPAATRFAAFAPNFRFFSFLLASIAPLRWDKFPSPTSWIKSPTGVWFRPLQRKHCSLRCSLRTGEDGGQDWGKTYPVWASTETVQTEKPQTRIDSVWFRNIVANNLVWYCWKVIQEISEIQKIWAVVCNNFYIDFYIDYLMWHIFLVSACLRSDCLFAHGGGVFRLQRTLSGIILSSVIECARSPHRNF